jgi:hypothetical protein
MKKYFVMTDAVYLLAGNEGSPRVRQSLVCYDSIECIQDISKENAATGQIKVQSRLILKCGEDFFSTIAIDEWAKILEQINQYFDGEDSKEDNEEGSNDNGEESSESKSEESNETEIS